jgi:hypothetical protein
LMLPHTTIRFSYGPRGPGFGAASSTVGTISVISQASQTETVPPARFI